MADLNQLNNSSPIRIVGGDELYEADVIFEDNIKKLMVKATSIPEALGALFFEPAKLSGSEQMAVNGAGTPQVFTVNAHASYDRIVRSMTIEAFDNGIKMNNFLAQNGPLTNGLSIEVKSQDNVFNFIPIKQTAHFDTQFAVGGTSVFSIFFASGNDYMTAKFRTDSPFIIKKAGTYATDDYIKVIVNDNLNDVTSLRLIAFGALDI